MSEEGRLHPDCRNASNPHHECSDFCFMIIAEAKKKMTSGDEGYKLLMTTSSLMCTVRTVGQYSQRMTEMSMSILEDEAANGLAANLTGGQKMLFELRLKMNEARKANQTAIVAEKKKSEAPTESRGISKQRWLDERKKKIGKLLDSNGLDMSKAYMLDTQVMAEAKYKKWEKDPAPAG